MFWLKLELTVMQRSSAK